MSSTVYPYTSFSISFFLINYSSLPFQKVFNPLSSNSDQNLLPPYSITIFSQHTG